MFFMLHDAVVVYIYTFIYTCYIPSFYIIRYFITLTIRLYGLVTRRVGDLQARFGVKEDGHSPQWLRGLDTWSFPKMGGPQIHPILVGFSMA